MTTNIEKQVKLSETELLFLITAVKTQLKFETYEGRKNLYNQINDKLERTYQRRVTKK